MPDANNKSAYFIVFAMPIPPCIPPDVSDVYVSTNRLVRDIWRRVARLRCGRSPRAALRPAAATPDSDALGAQLHAGAGGLRQPERAELGLRPELLQLRAPCRGAGAPPADPLQPPPAQTPALRVLTCGPAGVGLAEWCWGLLSGERDAIVAVLLRR